MDNTNLGKSELVGLVGATLVHAYENAAVYRNLWGGPPPTNLAGFRSLPLTTKKLLIQSHHEFLVQTLVCAGVNHTSGTTGRPLLVPRCREEIQATNQVLCASCSPSEAHPLGLSIRDNVHGIGIQYDTNVVWLGDPSFSPTAVQLGADYLNKAFRLPGCESRISYVFMSLLEALHFARYLQHHGFSPRNMAVKHILTTGFPLTQHWRRIIEEFWGVQLTHAYSATEVLGQALCCHQCRRYHHDAFSYIEFIHPSGMEPITDGVARVVATTLFPFTQMMPLVRYDIGDFVLVSSRCPRGIGFLPLGRREKTICDASGAPVVFPADILEAVCDVPWICRSLPTALQSLRLPGTETFGFPKFSMARDGKHVLVQIEGAPTSQSAGQKVIERVTTSVLERAFQIGANRFNVEVKYVPHGSVPFSELAYGCTTAGHSIFSHVG